MISSKKRIAGIYRITCIPECMFYIGSSKDVHTRMLRHRNAMKAGSHWKELMQVHFNQHGLSGFIFEVLEYCPHLSSEARVRKEKKIISSHNKHILYNGNSPWRIPSDDFVRGRDLKMEHLIFPVNKNLWINV